MPNKKNQSPHFDDYILEEEADNFLKRELVKQALAYVDENYGDRLHSDPVLQRLYGKWAYAGKEASELLVPSDIKTIYRNILEHQRQWLLTENHNESRIAEDVIRKHLRQIDLEEEKINFI